MPPEPEPQAKADKAPETTWSEKVKTIGGLVAVAVGVVVVGVIAIVALVKDSDTSATIASSAGGVIATIVGAYFGVKVGTDQAKSTLEGQQEEAAKLHKGQLAEAAKAQVYATHLPPDKAHEIMDMAEKAAREAISRQ